MISSSQGEAQVEKGWNWALGWEPSSSYSFLLTLPM